MEAAVVTEVCYYIAMFFLPAAVFSLILRDRIKTVNAAVKAEREREEREAARRRRKWEERMHALTRWASPHGATLRVYRRDGRLMATMTGVRLVRRGDRLVQTNVSRTLARVHGHPERATLQSYDRKVFLDASFRDVSPAPHRGAELVLGDLIVTVAENNTGET